MVALSETRSRLPTAIERPGTTAEPDTVPTSDLIQEGRYLATVGNCISCHTRRGGSDFSGGLAFRTPLGVLYSTNITPDLSTGIGRWSEADFIRAMRHGEAPNGRHLYPAFPYTSFSRATLADLKAIFAYLRSIKPIQYTPPRNDIRFSQRWAMALWNRMFFDSKPYSDKPQQSAEWNRGAYLTEGLAHCSACHTPRNFLMAEAADRGYSGGAIQEEVAENQFRRWSAVNLTPSAAGLKQWSEQEIVNYLMKGFSRRGGAFGPMNEIILHSTRWLSEKDLTAMAIYLKSSPVQDGSPGPSPTAEQIDAGSGVYKERCEKCHAPSGRGAMFGGPPLQGSAVVVDADPASLINVILYGADAPAALAPFGAWETMKPYRTVLTNDDVAAVADYVRNSWGNKGCAVTPSEVAIQR